MGRQQQHQTKTTNSQAATSPALQKSAVDSISEFQEIFGSRAASRQFRSQQPDAQSLASSLSAKLGMPTIQAKPSFRGLSSELTASTTSTIQPKLTIGEPGDKYEQEADRVAQDVVQRINIPEIATRNDGEEKKIQREPAVPLYQKVTATNGTLPNLQADFETELNQARGGGEPLDKAFRAKIEPAMNADFSGVRVHTDSQADLLNQSIQAKAFTTGQDVFFEQGAYQPESQKGQELLAHELTHVIQQNGSTVQRSPQLQEKNKSSPKRVEKVSQVGLPPSNIIQAMEKNKGQEAFNKLLSKAKLSVLEGQRSKFEEWLIDIQKVSTENPYEKLKNKQEVGQLMEEFLIKVQPIENTLLFDDSNSNVFGSAAAPKLTGSLSSVLINKKILKVKKKKLLTGIQKLVVFYKDIPRNYANYDHGKNFTSDPGVMGGFKRDWKAERVQSVFLYEGDYEKGYTFQGWVDFDHTPIAAESAESTIAVPDPKLINGHEHPGDEPSKQNPLGTNKSLEAAAKLAQNNHELI